MLCPYFSRQLPVIAMARTKQTARKSSGGKAPRVLLATKSAKSFRSYMTSQQSASYATTSSSSSSTANKTSYIVRSVNFLALKFDGFVLRLREHQCCKNVIVLACQHQLEQIHCFLSIPLIMWSGQFVIQYSYDYAIVNPWPTKQLYIGKMEKMNKNLKLQLMQKRCRLEMRNNESTYHCLHLLHCLACSQL